MWHSHSGELHAATQFCHGQLVANNPNTIGLIRLSEEKKKRKSFIPDQYECGKRMKKKQKKKKKEAPLATLLFLIVAHRTVRLTNTRARRARSLTCWRQIETHNLLQPRVVCWSSRNCTCRSLGMLRNAHLCGDRWAKARFKFKQRLDSSQAGV